MADLDSSKALGHFLPYQVDWILDESPMILAEKSVRIGWTYADSFKNVRKRLLHRDRDYLFATKDAKSAIEYMELCRKFCDIYKLGKSVLSTGEETISVQNSEGITEEIKTWQIKFETGSRIIAFSANPTAMAVFGGDVGLDEFAKHGRAELLWETAQGRATWGYDMGVWSAHNGTDTLFYQFAMEARAGAGGWTHYRITMEDAVAAGLLEKINAKTGKKLTPEEFIRSCRLRARTEEIYEQSYNCNPQGSVSAIASWDQITACRRPMQIERAHFEGRDLAAMTAHIERPHDREPVALRAEVKLLARGMFPRLHETPARYLLGFDVAASGKGDLSAIWIDTVERVPGSERGVHQLAGLFTTRTDDWDLLEAWLWALCESLTSWSGAGDETGLGRQICWRTARRFAQFSGVNFAREKHAMGFVLMERLTAARKVIPADPKHEDIATDIFAMRKIFQGGRWVFSEGKNRLNPASHCDLAWSAALATRAESIIADGTWSTEAAADAILARRDHRLPRRRRAIA